MAKLPYDEWLTQAESLDEGRRRRVNHTCGAGQTMVVSHDEDGYTAYCFRCNLHGAKPHGMRRLSDIDFKLLRKAEDEFRQSVLELPSDFTQSIPPREAVWLYKAGIFAKTAKLLGFGWSPAMARVIIPVYEDGRLVFLQARATDGRKPKYLNTHGINKDAVMWKYESLSSNDKIGLEFRDRIIVCEDILSAVRVTLAGFPAVSTLGTSVSDAQAGYLSRFKHVIFWYDGDDAGINGASKGMRKLRMVCQTSTIQTTNDPKTYNNREISHIVKEHYGRY